MSTTFAGIGGEAGSPSEAFPDKLLTKKKRPEENLMEENNNEFDDFDGIDTDEGFASVDELDTEGTEEIDTVDLEDVGSLKVGDKVLNVTVEDAVEDDETEEEFDEGLEDMEELEDEEAGLDTSEFEEDEEDEEDFDTFVEGFVGAAIKSPEKPADTLKGARKHLKKPASAGGKAHDDSESKPTDSIEGARAKSKGAGYVDDSDKGRDIDKKDSAVKKDKAQSPAESMKHARANSKGAGWVGDEPVDDGQENSTKNDGKQTSKPVESGLICYESFISKSQRIFDESFDSHYREVGRKKK